MKEAQAQGKETASQHIAAEVFDLLYLYPLISEWTLKN